MTLYLGTNPPPGAIHYPVIKIVPRRLSEEDLWHFQRATHVLYTSKHAAQFLSPQDKNAIAIGKVTASYLSKPYLVAETETQEGVIELLEKENWKDRYLFFPRSSLARPLLLEYLKRIPHYSCILYDTLPQKLEPIPDLDCIEVIIFTSPSTVYACKQIFPKIPAHIKLVPIGPITARALGEYYGLQTS